MKMQLDAVAEAGGGGFRPAYAHVFNPNIGPTAVFDIDGTLADCSHRLHHIQKKPKNFPAFFRDMIHDLPIEPIVNLLHMYYNSGYNIIISTGRPRDYEFPTIKWLKLHSIPYDKIYMRNSKDYRDDSIVKVELLEAMQRDGYNPEIWFDDRQRVVDAIRAKGIKVLQVAKGDF